MHVKPVIIFKPSCWCGVEVRKGYTSSGVVHVTCSWFKIARHSASSVERLANQRLHLRRDEVSDWLDAQRSTLTALV
ncbi:hypothetical protein TNCV_3616051 [Trichonephila clavipes]|nr:hypothetical protein TNCV_3616051 [Trichonephila clavipes]